MSCFLLLRFCGSEFEEALCSLFVRGSNNFLNEKEV